MRQTWLRLILAATVGVACCGLARAADDPLRNTRVAFLTSVNVYIDAGRDDGIDVGQTVDIVRDGKVVATLEVTYVSSHRAACIQKLGDLDLKIDDVVRYLPHASTPEPAPPAAPTPPSTEMPVLPAVTPAATPSATPVAKTAPPRAKRWGSYGLHGRVGVRYLALRSSDGFNTNQPALDLRLNGAQIFGWPIDIDLDVRARRVSSSAATTSSQNLTSVYRASVAWESPNQPWALTAGRQFSPSLASVNIFDGLQGEYRREFWSVGLFAGSQPKEGDLSYSTDVRMQGAFATFHNAREATRRWSATTGVVGSYETGEINREFVYLQATYMGPKLSGFYGQEIDVYRGWRQQAEGKSVDVTSGYLSLRYRINDDWTIDGGIDSRRNVRLYRDFITPETQFDDRYRRGGWAGVSARFGQHYRAGLQVRESSGGDAGSASSFTGSFGLVDITQQRFDFRLRSTRFTSDRDAGWLHSLSAGMPLGERWHIGANAGTRQTTPVDPLAQKSTTTWTGLDVDVTLGRHWFAWAEWERDAGSGDTVKTDQIYLSVAYRF